MAALADIELLVSTLCAPVGVHCEVAAIGEDSDVDALQRDAVAHLSGSELERFHLLRSPKRRAEYCAGRIAARRLLARQPFQLQPQTVEIQRLASGAPEVRFRGPLCARRLRAKPHVSISHCAGYVVVVAAQGRLGVDLERVEARSEAFGRLFLSTSERAALRAFAPKQATEVINHLWARKEAVSKVIGCGSRLAFRDLDCSTGQVRWGNRNICCNSNSHHDFVASLAFEESERHG